MIPLVLPPLHGLGVLVTRPVDQADGLLLQLKHMGALAWHWPTLSVEPLPFEIAAYAPCELLIFISRNAVTHGASLLQRYPQARLAAVGTATARALEKLGHSPDAVPPAGSSSEALLAHPLLLAPPAHVTLVRGQGGRELLQDTLIARGTEVTLVEAYSRRPVQPDAAALQQLQQHWQSDAIQVITATSVDVLQALQATLPEELFTGLQDITLLCGSARIAEAASASGWRGERVIARSPQESELLDALTRWHTRQRT